MVKVIVFDFDGVIVDSNRIKYNAFFDAFSDNHPEASSVISSVISENKFGTRFDVFRSALRRVGADERYIDRLVFSYAEDYNQIVQEGIKKTGLAPGALEILESFSEERGLYVNSGTYEPSLHQTMKNLGIWHFFRGAYGAPPSKAENFIKIFRKEGVGPDDVLFVGDGEPDRIAAENLMLMFVGIANEFNGWAEKGVNFPLIKNLTELQKFIN